MRPHVVVLLGAGLIGLVLVMEPERRAVLVAILVSLILMLLLGAVLFGRLFGWCCPP
jgi:putative Ca2+/H+ antiporter (TMEM165/GDT1 family)